MSSHDPEPFDEDDEALQWAGDDTTGRDAPRLGSGVAAAELDDNDGADETPTRSTADVGLLMLTIAFGVAYLAVTLGWIVSVQQLGYPALDLPGEIMWQFGEFLALVVGVIWFAAVLALTPEGTRHRTLVRSGWLALGLGVLIPWPYLLGALG